LRWAKGAFQIFQKANPLFFKGLALPQRFFYFSSVLHFFEGILRIAYYLFPAFYFIFHILPIKASQNITMLMLIYFISGRIIMKTIAHKESNFLLDDIYSIIRSFVYIRAIPSLFTKKEIRFACTPKDKKSNFRIRDIIGPLLILTFNITVLISALINPMIVLEKGSFDIICLIWVLYYTLLSFTACYFCFQPIKGRAVNAFEHIKFVESPKIQVYNGK